MDDNTGGEQVAAGRARAAARRRAISAAIDRRPGITATELRRVLEQLEVGATDVEFADDLHALGLEVLEGPDGTDVIGPAPDLALWAGSGFDVADADERLAALEAELGGVGTPTASVRTRRAAAPAPPVAPEPPDALDEPVSYAADPGDGASPRPLVVVAVGAVAVLAVLILLAVLGVFSDDADDRATAVSPGATTTTTVPATSTGPSGTDPPNTDPPSTDPNLTPSSVSLPGDGASVPTAPIGPGIDPALGDGGDGGDDFDREVADGLDGDWEVVGSGWSVVDQQASYTRPEAESGDEEVPGLALSTVEAADVRIQVQLPKMVNNTGIVFRYRDPDTYWAWVASPSFATFTLVRVIDGQTTVMGNSGLTTTLGGASVIGVNLVGQQVEVLVNGAVVKVFSDPDPEPGTRWGIGTIPGVAGPVTFDEVRYRAR